MEVSHSWGDMLPLGHAADKTRSAVEDELKFVELVLWQPVQQAVPVVKA